MNKNLSFGVVCIPIVSWDEMVRRFESIEALGFDSAWVGDHWASPFDPTTPRFEAWTLLSALTLRTKKIRIGVAVSPITWRNPAFLARQALTVDHISNGRFELGLGAGLLGDPSHAMTGIPDWSPKERVARFREYVEIVDRLLSNEVTTYDGDYYQIKAAVVKPRPVQNPRPPIMIAAKGPKMLRHVARYGDAWNAFGHFEGTFDEGFESNRRSNELLNGICEEIGRDPSTIRRCTLVWELEAFLSQGPLSIYESAEAFRHMVERYVEIGMTEFMLPYPFHKDQIPAFEKIAADVIPTLKR